MYVGINSDKLFALKNRFSTGKNIPDSEIEITNTIKFNGLPCLKYMIKDDDMSPNEKKKNDKKEIN